MCSEITDLLPNVFTGFVLCVWYARHPYVTLVFVFRRPGFVSRDQPSMERQMQAFANKCYRRILGISYREHKTNEYIWQRVSILAGRQELPLSTVKHHKLSLLGHVCLFYTHSETSIVKLSNIDADCRMSNSLLQNEIKTSTIGSKVVNDFFDRTRCQKSFPTVFEWRKLVKALTSFSTVQTFLIDHRVELSHYTCFFTR